MNNVSFDDLRYLHLLWVVLLVALAGAYALWQKQRALRMFASAELLARLTLATGLARPIVRLALATAALALLVGALIGPRWGEVEATSYRRGVDVIVLLDVSRSMLARDIAPNRLERAKLSIRDDLLAALGGDRIGLITFAGIPSLKCPLTTDYGFFRLALEDVSTGSSPRGGTLIGDAIRKAYDSFDMRLDTHKVIVLITDGEDQESFPVEAARKIWEDKKIPIVAVALGDEREGARIPSEGGDYLRYQGQVVWSKANFGELAKVAAVSPMGALVKVGTQNFDLGEIYRTRIVPAVRSKELLEKQQVKQPSRYHPFAAGALALLLIDSLLREAPRRRAAAPIRQEAA